MPQKGPTVESYSLPPVEQVRPWLPLDRSQWPTPVSALNLVLPLIRTPIQYSLPSSKIQFPAIIIHANKLISIMTILKVLFQILLDCLTFKNQFLQ